MNENEAACKVHTAPSTKNGENETACGARRLVEKRQEARQRVGCTPSRRPLHILPARLPAHPPCLPSCTSSPTSPPRRCSSPLIHTYTSFDSLTWRRWGRREPLMGAVAVIGGVCRGTVGRLCRCRREAVTWRYWAALSASSGAGDVACWGGLSVSLGPVTWHGLGGLSASSGAGLVSLGAGDVAWFVG
jgi:hypothetical protein